jgi:1,2-diacylglycerol 3-beta-glucosyltransferase
VAVVSTVLLVLAILVGLPAAVAAIQVTVFCIASLFYREPTPATVPALRFLVMVAARNEETVLAPTLQALKQDRRDRDTIVVVADRCTDRTAEIARQHGALVVDRGLSAEPGKAAALNEGLRYAADLDWDAVVFVDADSVVEPGFFDASERMLATGASVAQARSEAQARGGALGGAAVVTSALGGVAVMRGRDMLHGWVRLKGSGMMLRRDVAERRIFGSVGGSEDAQFSLGLCIDGYRHRHVDSARLKFAVARTVKAAAAQELRYESGRLDMARKFVPRLLRARGFATKDAALHLCTPPVSVTALLLVVSGMLALLAGAQLVALIAAALVVALGVDVVIAMIEARVGRDGWLALFLAPVYMSWKAWIQARALVRTSHADRPFEPTPRS